MPRALLPQVSRGHPACKKTPGLCQCYFVLTKFQAHGTGRWIPVYFSLEAGETDSRDGAGTLPHAQAPQGCSGVWWGWAGGGSEGLLWAKPDIDPGGWSHPLYFTGEEI